MMNSLEIIGMVLLAAITAAGIVIKFVTRRKLKDMDGISEIFLSGSNGQSGEYIGLDPAAKRLSGNYPVF